MNLISYDLQSPEPSHLEEHWMFVFLPLQKRIVAGPMTEIQEPVAL